MKLNQTAMRRDDRKRGVADEHAHVRRGTPNGPADHPIVFEHVQRPFNKERDNIRVKDARSANFGREARDADIDKRIVQNSRISRVIPHQPNGIEIAHSLHVGKAAVADDEGGDFQAGRPSVEVNREV